MTRARPALLLPLLAITACQTQRKPLTGFETPPPGTFLLDDGSNPTANIVEIWPIFDLPPTRQPFLPRLNAQDVVIKTSDEGFYDYDLQYLGGWTGGWPIYLNGVLPGTYTVELVDSNGESYGQSAPLPISPPNPTDRFSQYPAAILANYAGQVGAWTVDPATQDADPTTDEITVTNFVNEDVAVQRCAMHNEIPTSCVSVGTIAPGADFLTVETLAEGSVKDDHQALFIQLASDPSQFYQRDLLQEGNSFTFGASCEIERILVHGRILISSGIQAGTMQFAVSSCWGYTGG